MVGERYVLEVSSPGVERMLRTPADWRRFAGRKANVLSEALGGREEVEIVGWRRTRAARPRWSARAAAKSKRIPLAEVKEARLAFTW